MIQGRRDPKGDGIAPALPGSAGADRPETVARDESPAPAALPHGPDLSTPPLDVNASPDDVRVRAELVDRMRWLLAAGEIGRDYVGLADSLIVSMTRRS